MYDTIISVEQLCRDRDPEHWVLIDCRYDLGEPSAGYQAYLASHIAGAIFADLHDHLSGDPVTDCGRHPMPTVDKLRQVFSSLGIDSSKQVVAYDAVSGAFAARLWWMLRYMGHEAVAVLDGGWQTWVASNQAVESGVRHPEASVFEGEPRSTRLVLVDEVTSCPLLLDSREAARYRGEVEPVDPVAGHIPGAVNHYWKQNLTESGYFLQAGQLRAQFEQLYAGTPAEEVVFYCGSGVTACHNLLAVAHAGLADARLYAGSWSEWCSSPTRAIEIGPA